MIIGRVYGGVANNYNIIITMTVVVKKVLTIVARAVK